MFILHQKETEFLLKNDLKIPIFSFSEVPITNIFKKNQNNSTPFVNEIN